MWITAVACRNMMPDPAFYAECMRASHAELIEALLALPAHRAKAKRARTRRPAVAHE